MNTLDELSARPMEFLWLELTDQCNLHCVHCYADSGPHGKPSVLQESDYRALIREASGLGCKQIQFIGGEPTLNPSLSRLIEYARECGMEFVEVYTNARRLSDDLLACFIDHRVHVAVSFYSLDADIHDAITRVPGSQRATLANLRKLVEARIVLRVGIVQMPVNEATVGATIEFIRSMGVSNVGADRARRFGRAALVGIDTAPDIRELCGSCWQGMLCVHANGSTSPCIMSRHWGTGSVVNASLTEIVNSNALRDVRERVYREVWQQNAILENNRATSDCFPECDPTCHPRCSPSCQPCYPFGKCRPDTC